jgi:hypothetical protein
MKAAVAAIFAAGIVFAPLAQAEPGDPNAASNNDHFDQYMISRNMPGEYLRDGQNVCAALLSGSSTQAQVNQLETRLSVAEATNVVYAARRYLCPE